jgi:hypothetical protein
MRGIHLSIDRYNWLAFEKMTININKTKGVFDKLRNYQIL